jgi:hypothetical protein
MADEFRFNAVFGGAWERRYVRLTITGAIVLAVLALLGAFVAPVFAHRPILGAPVYVSRINHGQLQVCRVTSGGVKCPPLSDSLSRSYSPSKSKSYSPSKSLSTSTSVAAPSKSLSTSTSLSSSVRTQ